MLAHSVFLWIDLFQKNKPAFLTNLVAKNKSAYFQ